MSLGLCVLAAGLGKVGVVEVFVWNKGGGACCSLGWRPSFLAGGCLLGYPSRLELLVEAGWWWVWVGGGLMSGYVVVEGLRGNNHCHGWVGW